MIHICYGLRDESGNYSKYAGTSIQSLLDNTREEITIHILHDSTLSQDNRRKLTIIAYQHNQSIQFHNVEELAPEKLEFIQQKLPRLKNYWGTVASFYRALIPDFIDTDRVIYLDADVIVNLDIKEFWNVNLEDKPIAATPEMSSGRKSQPEEEVRVRFAPCLVNLVQPRDYFNAGVLLMDLNQVRKLGGGGIISIRELRRDSCHSCRFLILRSRRIECYIREQFFTIACKVQLFRRN